MPLDLNAVALALANTVSNAAIVVGTSQLTATDYPSEAIVEPQFCVESVEVDYHQTFGGASSGQDMATFKCRVYVARTTDVDSTRATRALLSRTGTSTSSVVVALEAARGDPGLPALGGAASDLTVVTGDGSRLYDVGAVQFVGADISVKVFG